MFFFPMFQSKYRFQAQPNSYVKALSKQSLSWQASMPDKNVLEWVMHETHVTNRGAICQKQPCWNLEKTYKSQMCLGPEATTSASQSLYSIHPWFFVQIIFVWTPLFTSKSKKKHIRLSKILYPPLGLFHLMYLSNLFPSHLQKSGIL